MYALVIPVCFFSVSLIPCPTLQIFFYYLWILWSLVFQLALSTAKRWVGVFKSAMDRAKNLLIYDYGCFQMICLLGLDTVHALSLPYLIGTNKGCDMLPDAQLIITLGLEKGEKEGMMHPGSIKSTILVFTVHCNTSL